MIVRLHPHARERLAERGATEGEVMATVEQGERLPPSSAAPASEETFRLKGCGGRRYATKQVEAYAVEDENAWLVITVVVKYFAERGTL